MRFTVGNRTFGFAPQKIADGNQSPSVSGTSATYDSIWPQADLAEHVSTGGVKEDVVIKSADGPSSFSFRLSGAKAAAARTGGLDLFTGGTRVGTIPAPTVSVTAGKSTLDQSTASQVRMTVSGDMVRVSVSPVWLASLPGSAFPVMIDPSYAALSFSSTWQISSVSDGGQVTNGVMQIGQDAAGANWRAEAYVPAPPAPTTAQGDQPWQFAGVYMQMQCDCEQTNTPIYGLPGESSFSDISGGQLLYTVPGPQSVVDMNPSIGWDGWSYLAGRADGWWFGPGTPTQVAGNDGGNLGTFDPSEMFFMSVYYQQPHPTTITSPADDSVVSTSTLTLSAPRVIDNDENDAGGMYYDFRVSTSADGTGAVIDSGWLLSGVSPGDPVNWTVPPGSLRDGVTYYARVLTSITPIYAGDPNFTGSLKPSSSSAISFQLKQRFGNGGPSPTDTVGSPPNGTTTPSKGEPSPEVPTASETVNLVTGNLAVTVGTPSMQTVAGSAGLALSYNSLQSSVSRGGNYGLTAQYYPDGGAHTFTGPAVGQRTDAAVNASWKGGRDNAPIAGLGVTDSRNAPFLVRWTGVLSLPAGSWQLGGVSTGGIRVYLNGASTPTYDDWAGAASTTSPSYSSATLNGSQTYQIEVDSWVLGEEEATDTVQLWAKNTQITDPTATNAWVVPSGWLTPVANGVPPGWSLQANPETAQWINADDEGDQVVLQGTSGQTATFTRKAQGYYQAQPGDDDHLNIDGTGHLQLATSDNELYTFNPDGTVASMTSATDDRHPAALQYNYSGTPSLLRSITDPVSSRAIALSYGGDAACPNSNPAPASLLCKVSYWDGTATTFGYNSNGQIAAVTNAVGQNILLAYDSDNRLADIRDPLADGYVAAGNVAGTPVSCPTNTVGLSVTPIDTQICYDSSGRVATVTQPAPTVGADRPARTYTYSNDHTDTAIAGFVPTSGYASRTAFDAQGRITQQSDSAGGTTQTVWANAVAAGQDCTTTCGTDEPIVTVTPAGEQTSTIYDTNGDVTDVYGPAPVACFSGGWPAGATPTAPVQGYLPVNDPQGIANCGIGAIAHTHNGYDSGMTGLAASFWSNGQAAGPVAVHTDGSGGTEPESLCGATSGRLCAHWDAGDPPVGSDADGQWSLRLTGTMTLASSGRYTFGVTSSQPITVSVDGTPEAHDGPDVSGFVAGQSRTTSASGGTQLTAGTHTIQVDFSGSATQLNEYAVSLTAESGSGGVIADTVLDPGYRLKTSTTDPDGVTTTTSYSDDTVGPEYGLVTSTTVGAGTSAALTTSTAYEPPSASTYLRKTLRTLPAGNATTYTYYTGTSGPLAAICGVTADTPQGGQLQSQTDPAPSSAAAAREQQFVYDAAGRQVGRRVGSSTSITSAPWQCTNYDAIGRITGASWPAFDGAPSRTTTYTYSVGGNPLVSSVADAGGTITATVDLLGRLVSYTDTTGKTSTISYDQAGQITATSGPQGAISNTYDPNSGNLSTVNAGGNLLATTHYDSGTERLTSVTYANDTTATLGYDAAGTEDSLVFTATATGGALVAGDQTTLSPGRRVTAELEDVNGTSLTNPNPAGSTATTYTYDGAGRLTTAYLPGVKATYGYGSNPTGDNCADANQGVNTNRTNVTITATSGGATSTDYCYNNADQLVSSITGSATNSQYTYDQHGNQTNDGGTTLAWDADDRLTTTTTASGTATGYTYDALDRVISHATATATVHYAYAGYTDAPVATLDASNTVKQELISLPGGVLLTAQSSGNIWSYPDLHGNYTVTAADTGIRQSTPITYDPWGQADGTNSVLNNAAGGNTMTTFGSNNKLTDSTTAITILGARAYQASEARFLSVDPIDGGCANNYTYATGDPFSISDFTGQKCSSKQTVGSVIGITASGEAMGQTGEAEAAIAENAAEIGWGTSSYVALGLVGMIGAGFGALAGYLIYHLATGCKK